MTSLPRAAAGSACCLPPTSDASLRTTVGTSNGGVYGRVWVEYQAVDSIPTHVYGLDPIEGMYISHP